MATQTVEFRSPPSQTVTAKLFTVGSDTEQASVSATEATNRKGTYSAAFTDETAGEYELIAFVGSVPVARWFVTLTLTTATFQTYDKVTAGLDSSITTQLDAIEADSAASVGYLTTLVSRLTANAATAIQNLYHMITGTGASSKYTTAALENAPSGGGGGGDAEQDTLLEVQTTVNALALSLAGSSVTVTSRVSGSEITAYIGDDYKVRSGTELEITVSDTGGALHTKLAAIGTSNLYFGASLPRKDPGQITGTISSLSYATNVLTIAVEITACASGLTTGDYTYQIQSSQAQSGSYDDYIELEGTFVVKQRTVAVRG